MRTQKKSEFICGLFTWFSVSIQCMTWHKQVWIVCKKNYSEMHNDKTRATETQKIRNQNIPSIGSRWKSNFSNHKINQFLSEKFEIFSFCLSEMKCTELELKSEQLDFRCYRNIFLWQNMLNNFFVIFLDFHQQLRYISFLLRNNIMSWHYY